MKKINFNVLGVGAWGPSFRNWQDLQSLMSGEPLDDDGAKGPKPDVIPANERRRAPLPVRLAVESSSQACADADLDPSDLACVFVSGLGDTQLTDYMCKVLAGDNKALSPTKFHNSVHNAAAGYWTISTDCMHAANSVAGFTQSVSLTLIEALIQAEAEQRALLLTFYDAPSSPVLKELLKNELPFAVSMVVIPTCLADGKGQPLMVSIQSQQSSWPKQTWQSDLQHCYEHNPVARILPFLELLTGSKDETLMPLSPATSLIVSRGD